MHTHTHTHTHSKTIPISFILDKHVTRQHQLTICARQQCIINITPAKKWLICTTGIMQDCIYLIFAIITKLLTAKHQHSLVLKCYNNLGLQLKKKSIIAVSILHFNYASLMSNVLGVPRGAHLYTAGYAKQSFLHSAVSAF